MITNQNYHIAALKPNMQDTLYAIEQTASPTHWTETMIADCFAANYTMYGLYLEDQSLVAYIVLSVIKDEAEILNLVVETNARKQGLGRALLTHAIDALKTQNIKRIFLEVRASNHAAETLYTQTGFKTMLTRKAYYRTSDGREDALLMTINL